MATENVIRNVGSLTTLTQNRKVLLPTSIVGLSINVLLMSTKLTDSPLYCRIDKTTHHKSRFGRANSLGGDDSDIESQGFLSTESILSFSNS